MNCKESRKVYIEKTNSCEYLNSTTLYDDCGNTSPVPMGYIICSKEHNLDIHRRDKLCRWSEGASKEPCKSYGGNGSIGYVKY